MKISPFGATRIWRGALSPSANNSILNPDGTCSDAPGGLATTRDELDTDGVAPGAGISDGLINRLTPGLSVRQSPNAAGPVSGSHFAAVRLSAANVDRAAP